MSWAKRGLPADDDDDDDDEEEEEEEEGEEEEEEEEEEGEDKEGDEEGAAPLLPSSETESTMNEATASAAVTLPFDRCVQRAMPTQQAVATVAESGVGGVMPAPTTPERARKRKRGKEGRRT